MKIKNKRVSNIVAIFIILAIAIINNTNLFTKPDPNYEVGIVVRVVDGDTAVIKINNENQKVRFVGMDTPEYNPKRDISEPWGKEATEFTKNLLENQIVYLEKDTSDTDKYGRWLRYIWLNPPENPNHPSYEEIKNQMVNGILVRNGYARAKEYKPDVKYTGIMRDIEQEAKIEKIGLWS
ncbi:thermonuclease family protein [Anaerococcus sp. ENR1011]|uniref:Thermonuclease family protein n=1 Tax=Anaerococcus groningensis TaxID=3115616 RepID=A0ABW9N204_9FIRM